MSADATMSAIEANTGPDWSAIALTVPCPLCDYDLRGLPEPRCPECGYRFEWAQVLDPTKRRHAYLFEHHPERNVSSFAQTLLGGFRPRRFWTTLQPQQPSSVRRLMYYWLACVILTTMWLAPVYLEQVRTYASFNAAQRIRTTAWYSRATQADQIWLLGRRASLQELLDDEFPVWHNPRLYVQAVSVSWTYDRNLARGAASLTAWTVWPWASVVTFLFLRTSMRAARIRLSHVLRVMIYSFDAVALPGAACLAVYLFDWLASRAGVSLWSWFDNAIWFADRMLNVLEILILLRLFYALRNYLRLRHAVGVIMASQVMASLIVIILLLLLPFTSATMLEQYNELFRAVRRARQGF